MPADDRGERLAKIAADREGMSDEDRAEILVRLGQGVPLEDVEAFIADRRQRAGGRSSETSAASVSANDADGMVVSLARGELT